MKFIVQIICVLLVCYVLIGTAIYFFQEKMLFFPMGQPFGKCPVMDRYKAAALEKNGVRYYLKTSVSPEARIIVFHGNAGNACDRTYFFDLMAGVNAEIFLFEYPGYGGDGQKPGEILIRQRALDMVRHIKNTGQPDLPVYLVGESMGTGVATWVSTKESISGLILISAYTSLADVAAHHYPWLPVKRLMKHTFKASEWAKGNDTPAVLFHGKEDDIIPIEFARRQVENFKSGTRLIEIERCGHNDILDTGYNLIRKEIGAFIRKHSKDLS